MSSMFKFERDNLDFPLYRSDSFLSLSNLIVMLASIIIIFITIFVDIGINDILFLVVPVVALLWITRGKISLVCRKFKLNDVKVIILCWIAYFIFSIGFLVILSSVGIEGTSNSALDQEWGIISFIIFAIELFIEEIIRFIPFILVLSLVYKFSENRKFAVIMALIISSLYFGIIHTTAYGNILYAVLNIGTSSMLLTFPYIKTKNLLVSFMTHLLVDMTCVFFVIISPSLILLV